MGAARDLGTPCKPLCNCIRSRCTVRFKAGPAVPPRNHFCIVAFGCAVEHLYDEKSDNLYSYRVHPTNSTF